MEDILLTGGTVITMDAGNRILRNHAIALRDGKILEIGPSEEMQGRYPEFHRIDCSGHCLLPGLIDCHGHAGHSILRGRSRETPAYWNHAIRRVTHEFADEEFWYY